MVDGQDVFAVYEAAGEAVARARVGDGPSFLECKTYRYYGHFLGDDPLRYRTQEEEAHHRSRDCIERFERAVAERHVLSEMDLSSIRDDVIEVVERAVTFAESSPAPEIGELTTDVYA